MSYNSTYWSVTDCGFSIAVKGVMWHNGKNHGVWLQVALSLTSSSSIYWVSGFMEVA